MACDMSLRDAKHNTCFGHVSSVSTGFSNFAHFDPKMVRIYLFTSTHLRYKGNEAKKHLRLSGTAQISYLFGKHC